MTPNAVQAFVHDWTKGYLVERGWAIEPIVQLKESIFSSNIEVLVKCPVATGFLWFDLQVDPDVSTPELMMLLTPLVEELHQALLKKHPKELLKKPKPVVYGTYNLTVGQGGPPMPVTKKPSKNAYTVLAVQAEPLPALSLSVGSLTASPTPTVMPAEQAESGVTIKHPDGSTTNTVTKMGKEQVFAEPPCHIGFKLGCTLPLAPYTSAKAEVWISVPCAHGEIDQVYGFAKKWVEDRMEQVSSEIQANAAPTT